MAMVYWYSFCVVSTRHYLTTGAQILWFLQSFCSVPWALGVGVVVLQMSQIGLGTHNHLFIEFWPVVDHYNSLPAAVGSFFDGRWELHLIVGIVGTKKRRHHIYMNIHRAIFSFLPNHLVLGLQMCPEHPACHMNTEIHSSFYMLVTTIFTTESSPQTSWTFLVSQTLLLIPQHQYQLKYRGKVASNKASSLIAVGKN